MQLVTIFYFVTFLSREGWLFLWGRGMVGFWECLVVIVCGSLFGEAFDCFVGGGDIYSFYMWVFL